MRARAFFPIALLLLAIFVSLYHVEFAAASTPAGTITYDAPTNTITVIGANSSHPAEFLDLYNADVAGGWGKVTRLNTNQFLFMCKLHFGNGSTATYVKTLKEQITFGTNVAGANDGNLIYVDVAATFTSGQVDDTDDKLTNFGSDIFNACPNYWGTYIIQSYGSTYLYSTRFTSTHTGDEYQSVASFGGTFTVWNSVFNHVRLAARSLDNAITSSYYNIQITGVGSGNFQEDSWGNQILVENCIFTNGLYAFEFGEKSKVLNCKVIGSSFTRLVSSAGVEDTSPMYLVNVESDIWAFNWAGAWADGEIYRQYTYDLTVLNGEITDIVENANVTLTKNGVNLGSWLTNSSGQIPTQTLTYGFYNQTGGDTMYDGAYPFYLTITHNDWANYTSKFYCTEKTNWVVSMQNKTDTAVYQTIVEGTGNMLIVALLTGLILAILTVTIVTKRRNR